MLDAVIKGDTVREVLDYVEFDAETLVAQAARTTSKPPCAKGASTTKSPAGCCEFYEDGLHGYTYLEDPKEQLSSSRDSARSDQRTGDRRVYVDAELVERLRQLRRDHLRIAALDLASLHHVDAACRRAAGRSRATTARSR